MLNKTSLLILGIIVFMAAVAYAAPIGAFLTADAPEKKPTTPAGTNGAGAGNVTYVNLTGESVTLSWQGYYGEVSGVITLDNANNYTLYNWTVTNAKGEVYAANETVTWTNVQCFNFTAAGTFADDSGNAGGTSKFGMSLAQLELSYNLSATDVDGVNETFRLIGASTHDSFFTGPLSFNEGECRNTRILSQGSGVGQNDKFEEVLLYDPDGKMPVFASILEQNLAGFDTAAHDFEMLVLEKGRQGNTLATTYYFYVELE